MKRIAVTALPFLIVFVAVTGCSSTNKSDASSTEKNPVSIQMAWTHEYSSAGLYTAEKNGHFAEQGLAVTLGEGGFGANGYIEPIAVVVDGTYDFGMTSAEALIRAKAAGAPVVAIATIMQRSPSAVISLAENDLQRPQDLLDHTVLVADGGALNLYNALLEGQNIAEEDINTLPRTDFGVAPLLNGETDALFGWIINEGVEVQEAGETPNFILLSDYGIDTYNVVLFTTQTTIDEKPQMVENVVEAVLEGYQDVIDNPTQAVDYVVEYNSTLDKAGQLRRMEAMIPLINLPGQNLGTMDGQIWIDTQDMMLEAGSLETAIDIQSVYNTSFLDAIYSN
jgi:NitT/TauT family transport system substrate-binding protein